MICKQNKPFLQEYKLAMLESLNESLKFSPGDMQGGTGNGSVMAMQERALLFTGHLIVVILQ